MNISIQSKSFPLTDALQQRIRDRAQNPQGEYGPHERLERKTEHIPGEDGGVGEEEGRCDQGQCREARRISNPRGQDPHECGTNHDTGETEIELYIDLTD